MCLKARHPAADLSAGIRREDKNVWERRAPLTPAHVKALVDGGARVLVQPSNIRVFTNEAYAEAGAIVQEDLSPCRTILAVKEVPPQLLLPRRTYCFFSHTIKAQPANMPLLDSLLEKKIRLIDYEAITDGGARGARRLVAFGRFAGIAGMVDYLRGLGERFLAMGFSTPFLSVAAMYTYPDIGAALAAVRAVGVAIQRYGLPVELCPLTVAFTGDGNVSKGAQEVLSELGAAVTWLASPFEFESIIAKATGAARTHIVYAAVAKEEHMVRKRVVAPMIPSAAMAVKPVSVGGAATEPAFDKADYKAHPDDYEPIFHLRVIPFTSVLVHCCYWEPRFPRLLTAAQARELARCGRLRLIGVCDISCDFEGAIEFLRTFTSIEDPFFVYDPENGSITRRDMAASGLLYHSVDHLPSECPRDASEHFGACLLPLLPSVLNGNDAALPREVTGAIVTTYEGHLSANFDYIAALREAAERAGVSRALRGSRCNSFLTLNLMGHLFDSGIINKILDIVEDGAASASIVNFQVGRDRSTPTELSLQLFAPPKCVAR